jgi:hypothetical protein
MILIQAFIATALATFLHLETPAWINWVVKKTGMAKPWTCRPCMAFWIGCLSLNIYVPLTAYLIAHILKTYESK